MYDLGLHTTMIVKSEASLTVCFRPSCVWCLFFFAVLTCARHGGGGGQVLKQLLRIPPAAERESFGEFGCMTHSGVLDKTQILFDFHVKVMTNKNRNQKDGFFDWLLPKFQFSHLGRLRTLSES